MVLEDLRCQEQVLQDVEARIDAQVGKDQSNEYKSLVETISHLNQELSDNQREVN